eukprot:gene31804-42420_t
MATLGRIARLWHGALMDRARLILRWLLAAIYLLAGVLHVVAPHPFLTIVPAWVPFPDMVVLLTGLCEIAGAVGLMTRRWRWLAAVLLALYAVFVFPANIKHAIDGLVYDRNTLGWAGVHLVGAGGGGRDQVALDPKARLTQPTQFIFTKPVTIPGNVTGLTRVQIGFDDAKKR